MINLLKTPEKKEYYRFLAGSSFSSLTIAEDYFNISDYNTSITAVFQASEFFWKALTILSGREFILKSLVIKMVDLVGWYSR